ncbi:hypothetical protein GEMRC1_014061 [Eukaryota sp. GEM-RC1]
MQFQRFAVKYFKSIQDLDVIDPNGVFFIHYLTPDHVTLPVSTQNCHSPASVEIEDIPLALSVAFPLYRVLSRLETTMRRSTTCGNCSYIIVSGRFEQTTICHCLVMQSGRLRS